MAGAEPPPKGGEVFRARTDPWRALPGTPSIRSAEERDVFDLVRASSGVGVAVAGNLRIDGRTVTRALYYSACTWQAANRRRWILSSGLRMFWIEVLVGARATLASFCGDW
ncbi:hypothetical protein ZWY2020_049367 [Hordeum vulgare]|nr:hypothetical protein ZWY2020_049367 [Hordeum vulgare]